MSDSGHSDHADQRSAPVKTHCCKRQQQQSGTDGHARARGWTWPLRHNLPARTTTYRFRSRSGPAAASRALPRHLSVTSGVLAPGNFSTTKHQPRPAGDDRVPDQRLVIHLDVGDVASFSRAGGALDRDLARVRLGSAIFSSRCRT